MPNSHQWRLGLVSTALGLVWLATPPYASAMASPVAFDISAQPMPAALHQFAAQAHLQLLFDYDALQGLEARHLKAHMEPSDALAALLKGSGFVFQQVNDRTFAIRSALAGPAAQAVTTSGEVTGDKEGKQGASGSFRLAQVAHDAGAAPAATVDAPTPAAPAPASSQLQTVTVTGSRLITNAALSPTPVTSLNAQQLSEMNPGPISRALATVPALVSTPGQDLGGNGAIQSTFNLRGLGSDRNLILFDGYRVADTTSTEEVDTNLIPQMLVKRVEIVTGGASAVYGSDAVSGVVNYVIDHDFNGLEVTGQRGESTYQDDKTWNGGVAMGTDLFGGRGHVEASVEFFNDPGIDSRLARSASAGLWGQPGTVAGSTAAAGTAANPYGLADDLRLSQSSFGGLITSGPLAGLQFAQNGVLSQFVNGEPTGTSTIQRGGDGDYYSDEWLWSGENMGQGFGRFDYSITDNVKAFAELAVGAVTYTGDNLHGDENVLLNNVKIGYNNAYLSGVGGIQPQYASVIADELAANPLSSFTFGKMTTPEDNFPAPEDQTHESQYLVITGLNGALGDYTWNVGYEWQRSTTAEQEFNTISYPRLYAALNAVVDPSTGQVVCNAALVNPSAYGNCVPLDVFGPSASSQAAFNYIATNTESWTTYGMNSVTASLVGAPIRDWVGPVNMAWSANWRELTYEVGSDASPTAPVDCTGIQFNCTASTTVYYNGATSDFPQHSEGVSELAYETDIPLLKNDYLAKSLTLNGAARFTHYTQSGSVWTWKLGSVWALNDAFRIRVTRSYDIRAPGLQDLYEPATYTTFPFVDLHTGGTSGVINTVTEGNPNLKPEKAKTWTAGFVWTPQFFEGGQLSLDFYHIYIGDALVTISPVQAADEAACDNSGGSSPICALLVRPYPFSDTSPNNFPTLGIDEELNTAYLLTYGMDGEFDYAHFIAGHNFGARLLVNYEPHLVYNMGPAGTVDVGDSADGVGGMTGTPSVRATLAVNYAITPPFSVTLQERYANGMKQNGSTLLYYATPALSAMFYTDVNLGYSRSVGNGVLNVYFNVQNVFNRQPQPWASASGTAQVGAVGGYLSDEDVLGRYFTLGVKYLLP